MINGIVVVMFPFMINIDGVNVMVFMIIVLINTLIITVPIPRCRPGIRSHRGLVTAVITIKEYTVDWPAVVTMKTATA
jgi:hypothetical protein